jgi:hypothetical protein
MLRDLLDTKICIRVIKHRHGSPPDYFNENAPYLRPQRISAAGLMHSMMAAKQLSTTDRSARIQTHQELAR